MMGRVLALCAMTACFNPHAATGVKCSDQGACPLGQRCELATDTCELAFVDGHPGDRGFDGGACDPTEIVIDGACAIPITMETGPAPISATACDTSSSNTETAV